MSADPVGPVQRQLEAYNARDLEAFVAQYAEDVTVYRMPDPRPSLAGRKAFSEHYRLNRFNLPGLHAEILGRIVMGDKVIDHERITGVAPEPMEAVAIYEVRGGLIATVWFLRPDPAA